MAKKLLTGTSSSSKKVLLIIIVLSFMLLMAMIWLWYDLELTKIKGQMDRLSFLQSSYHIHKKVQP